MMGAPLGRAEREVMWEGMPEVEAFGERERMGRMEVGAKCAVDFLTFL